MNLTCGDFFRHSALEICLSMGEKDKLGNDLGRLILNGREFRLIRKERREMVTWIKPGRKKEAWLGKGLWPLLFLFPFFMGGAASVCWAAEKSYPTKPINMVFAYGPGGPHDIGSRVIADHLGKFLGQPLISIYKPGGGGVLGTAFVAKSKPDGYTILVGSSSALVLSIIVKKLDYKLDDFEFIGIYGESPVWLAVKADARWKTLRDFVGEAKKFPGQIKVSSFGKLSSSDFVIELLGKEAKIKLTNVPYKSTPEALTAVLGGHADAAMVVASGGLIEDGAIRILAIAGEQRLEDLPDVPTFKELGYPIEYSTWQSLCVPRGTPQEIVGKLRLAQEKALAAHPKEIKEGLRKVWIRPVFLDPLEHGEI